MTSCKISSVPLLYFAKVRHKKIQGFIRGGFFFLISIGKSNSNMIQLKKLVNPKADTHSERLNYKVRYIITKIS